MSRRALLAALTTIALIVGLVALVQAQPTLAAWTRSSFGNTTLNSGKVYPVTSLTCSAPNGLIGAAITLNWTQPQSTGNGLVPTSYTMSWSGTAGTGQITVTGLSGTIPPAGLGVGNLTVVVYANFGTWQSDVSTQSRAITTVAVIGVVVSWTCA
jgi:hypothetical protein